jgi:hypothetical protein
MISCQFCVDLSASGNSVSSMCNLTTQHRLTRVPPHHLLSSQNHQKEERLVKVEDTSKRRINPYVFLL